MQRVILILALVLLFVLAAMQYHWLGDVTRAERARLQSNLDVSLNQFCDDLDFELLRLSMLLVTQTDADLETALIQGRTAWRERSAFPELLDQLILVRQEGELGAPMVRILNDDASEFVVYDGIAPRVDLGDDRRRRRRRGVRINAVPPVIHIPIFTSPRERPELDLFVQLNEAALYQDIIPQRAARYFSPEYQIQVRNRADEQLLSGTNQVPISGQGRAFFQLRAVPSRFKQEDYIKEELARKLIFRDDQPGRGGRRGGPFERGFDRSDLEPGTLRALLNARHVMDTVRINTMEDKGLLWLHVDRFDGSLEDVLARSQRRNLATAGGVLVLLAVGMIIVWRGAQRTRALAQRQLDFVAGVSHELMTPLAGIRSAAQNLAAGVVVDQKKVAGYGSLIDRESGRLTTLIEQVLGFAGIQSGKQRYNLEVMDPGLAVQEGLNACADLLGGAGFDLDLQVAEDLPSVALDVIAFERVIRNLVGNAVKYAGAGAWLGVSVTAQGKGVAIAFRDKGPGLDRTDLPHLFDPFSRGKDHVASNIGGSGLGLAIVRNMIKAHGGTITAANGDSGAVFTITLPRADA